MFKKLLIGLGLLGFIAGAPAKPAQPVQRTQPTQSVTPKKPLSRLVLDKEKFDLEKAKIIKYADYKSKNIVVFIMSHHYLDEEFGQYEEDLQGSRKQSFKVKKEIYSTLEELTAENHSRFIGAEGYEGEFSEEKIVNFPKNQRTILEFLVEVDAEDKKSLAELFCFEFGHCPAAYAFELVNGDKVFTYGVNRPTNKEKKITINFQKAKALLRKHVHLLENGRWGKLSASERTRIAGEVFNPYIDAKEKYVEILQRRSKLFVENLLEAYKNWEKQGNKSNVIVLVGGGEHYSRDKCKTVTDYFDELSQSYIVLKPNSYK